MIKALSTVSKLDNLYGFLSICPTESIKQRDNGRSVWSEFIFFKTPSNVED